ncbi:MAG: hypothetical protein WC593_06390 [Methanoregula sp.]
MHIRIVSCMVITTLILLTLFSGCTSGPAQEKPVIPASEKTPATVHSATEIRTTHPTIRPTEIAPAVLPAGTKEHTFEYVLNGVKGTVSVPLSDSVYADYAKKPDPAYKSPYDANSNSSYYRGYITDSDQQPYIEKLAQAIQEKTPNKDDQARIAVSLVQHIPYKVGGKQYRYPYEVLYKNQGVCGEKSMLLALLLKDLGFGSSVFYLLPEDHMTAGIKASSPYDFRNSGYAFIEATEPYIITDSTTDNLAQWKFTGTLELTPVGTGQALQSIVNDYNDAREWAVLEAKVKNLSPSEYQTWQALNTKYDLSYYT